MLIRFVIGFLCWLLGQFTKSNAIEHLKSFTIGELVPFTIKELGRV